MTTIRARSVGRKLAQQAPTRRWRVARAAVGRAVRRCGRILAAAFAVALVHVGAATAQTAAPTKLDFAGSVTWLGMVPIMVAVEKGFFKEVGLDVEYRVVLNSSDRIRALTAGDVAFSNVGSVAALSEMSRGNQSFYLFANVDDSPGSEGCWARPGFASFAALKGRTVAANASAEITMHGLLAASGMSVKDIKFVNLSPNELAGALAKGDIDAACIWEPLLSGLKKAVPDGHLAGMDLDTPMHKKFGTMSAPDIVIISKKLVDQYPEQAAKLALAMFKGADFTTANPEEAAKAVAPLFRKPVEEVLAGIKGFKYFGFPGWPEHMRLHGAQMQELANWLHENKKIDNAPDVARWLNIGFLPKP
jgi:NitT/TauT family transport system substrate-binding protein